MAEKKSILEEAMLDVKKIQAALNANTKEILRSVAKEEIDSVVKESLMVKEEEYEEEDLDADTETGLDDAEMGGAPEMGGADELGGEELGLDDVSGEEDIDGSEEVGPIGMDSDLGMDADALGGDEMDMTASSDDEVIAIYKKLSGEDEIEIVGDEIHLNVSEPGEYVVKLNDTSSSLGDEMPTDDLDLDGLGDEEGLGDDTEGVDYEIEMGDDEDEESEYEAGEEAGEEEGEEAGYEAGEEAGEEEEEETEELEENIGNVNGHAGHQGQRRNGASHLGFGKKSVDGEKLDEAIAARKLVNETAIKYNRLLTEAKKLQTENEEFRKALKEFRTKLVETVVFNSNLTYVTRILMEHSTTKAEKQNIIKRFDEEVTNLKESKNLYKSIVNELDTRKPLSEAIENKISKEVTTSSSKQLNESTAYVDPSTKRIIDLMKRVG